MALARLVLCFLAKCRNDTNARCISTMSNTSNTNPAIGQTLPVAVPRLADFARGDRASLISSRVVRDAVRLADFVVAVATGMLVATFYLQEFVATSPLAYTIAIMTTSALVVVVFELLGLYQVPVLVTLRRQLARVAIGWSCAFAALALGVFFLKAGGDFSRVWLAVWFVAGSVGLIGERIVVARMVQGWTRAGRLYRRAVVYGTGDVANDVLAQLERDGESDVRISGIFDARENERSPEIVSGYPKLGSLEDLVEFARNTRIDVIIMALPIKAEERIAQVQKTLSQLPVDIKLPSQSTCLRFAASTYSHLGNAPMITLMEKPISAWGGIAKRVFDFVVATIALVLLSPVLGLLALAVKLESKGPVLFRQKRYGFNNELIEVFKFRSMYIDKCDAEAKSLVTKNDPRVTHVGQFIRKSSLDELPQLFNVLRGELSLVGPRPHALSAKAGARLYNDVVEGYFARHKVKPGITGWAQINGWRGETDTAEKIEKRVEHDLDYIENWSVFFDLYILAKTPFALFQTKNAY